MYKGRGGVFSRYLVQVFAGVAAVFFILGAVGSTIYATDYLHIRSLLEVISKVRSEYIEPVNTTQLVDGAIKGIVESLDDPYSVYLEPKRYKDLQEQMHGSFGGVGIYVAPQGEHITVVAPIKGTPAFRKGIKTGDIITKIDQHDATKLDIDRAVELMRGPVGTTVTISVVRDENGVKKPLDFPLVRENIVVPSVESEMVKGEKIGHIRLTVFNENTRSELAEALKNLQDEQVKAIILDLRNNPGGELNAAADVAGFFVPKGKVVTIRDRNGSEDVLEADGSRVNYPLVVLVNGYSASASEIVAGAIKDTKSGTLIGTKTYGKGVVQTIYKLSGQSGLKITTAKYFTPSGHDIHKKGIVPDVVVEQPEESKEDLQLNKAIEVLKKKL